MREGKHVRARRQRRTAYAQGELDASPFPRPEFDATGAWMPAKKATLDLAPVRHSLPEATLSDETSVLEFERAVRVHRAHVESFNLTVLDDDGTPPATFLVRGASGGAYFVDVVDSSGDNDSCSCPDFMHGRLGACKHIEAVRRALALPRLRQLRANLPPSSAALPGPVLTARADGVLRLAIVGPRAKKLVDALSARTSPDGSLVISPERIARAGDVAGVKGARVTHAAVEAARVLEQRRTRFERWTAIGDDLNAGRLKVDVLSAPLFPYQREGVAHLVRAGRAVLADDMGLGKTVQTIAACEMLRRRGEARRILIVCPASLKAQWASEIAKYAGAHAVVVAGGVEARRTAFGSDAPYVILNYELTWRDLSVLRTLEADVLVLDEAQRAKNFRTKTAATLKRIPSRFLFVLTGTPVENRLDDLYGILQLVDPDVLGPLWKFNLDFHVRDQKGKIVGYQNLAALRRVIAPVVLRRRKEEVLSQLPALTEQTRYVALSSEQIALEEHYRRAASMLIKTAERRALSPAEQKRLQAALLKARQACDGAVLCDPESTERVPAKIEELALLVGEIAQQGTSKVLVFSEWTEMLKLAAERLDAMGIGHLMLHGGVPSDARPAMIDRFKNDDEKVVLLSTDAGGVGLNLQVASYVVHLDLPWNPARLDQRISRAHRLGQTRGVSVTYLCAESGIERGIEGTLAGKRAVRSAATDGGSEVDTLAAPSFTMFLRQARDVLTGRAGEEEAFVGREGVPMETDRASNREDVPSEPAPSDWRARAIEAEAELPSSPATSKTSAAARDASRDAGGYASVRSTEAFARQRLRLAHVVLDAGFPGDAVRAAYEAVAASLRARLEAPIADDHPALVAAVYRELLPAGAIPSTLPGVLAKIHDLSVLAEHDLAIDDAIAASAVEEARGWLERDDVFVSEDRRRRGASAGS